MHALPVEADRLIQRRVHDDQRGSRLQTRVAPKDADSTRALREDMPHTPFLVPGYGAQGGTAAACRPCFRPDGSGAIVNASRSVIYAYEKPDCAERFGSDWHACVEQACRDFVEDVRQAVMS